MPPPFNIVPSPKSILRMFGYFGCRCAKKRVLDKVVKAKGKVLADQRFTDVMKCIVRRYITSEQKKAEEFAITEDDVSEIRQDINKFRYEMIDILRHNNFETPNIDASRIIAGGKRAKQMERRVLKGFNINTADMLKEAFSTEEAKNKDFFSVIAKTIGNKDKDSSAVKRAIAASPDRGKRNLVTKRIPSPRFGENVNLRQLDADELVQMNPRLESIAPQTRLAYARFKSLGLESKQRRKNLHGENGHTEDSRYFILET